ncbi:hypothetical protein DV713_00100 [Parageobacillus thermoglucosidasius]|uniref:hypothetical protein n=1 Tax=Parageobacillus thermoglucosidasius TaxID=1426 RepID=UPI000E15BF82|nr:hypothetical protein [Parageobacillus thermoglucosidasius]RDE36631.1 hypothetical protein DV713_00100 [Parageobacillus thermoglucosidasius]
MVGETLTLDNRTEDERVQQKEQLAGTVDSSEDDNLNFDFFNVGNEGLLNLGLGINIDPNKIFSAERGKEGSANNVESEKVEVNTDNSAAEKDFSESESVEPILPEGIEGDKKEEIKEENDSSFTPGLSFVEAEEESVDNEPLEVADDIDFNLTLEDYAKKLKEIRISNKNIIKSNIIETDSLELPKVEAEQVSDQNLLLSDIDSLEEAYKEQTLPVKEKIVEVDKVTAADRAGKAVNWVTQTFILLPIRAIFKAVYAFLFNIFGFFGGILKFIIVSLVLTTLVAVFYTYSVNPDLSAKEMVLESLNIIVEVVRKIGSSIWEVLKPIFVKINNRGN